MDEKRLTQAKQNMSTFLKEGLLKKELFHKCLVKIVGKVSLVSKENISKRIKKE